MPHRDVTIWETSRQSRLRQRPGRNRQPTSVCEPMLLPKTLQRFGKLCSCFWERQAGQLWPQPHTEPLISFWNKGASSPIHWPCAFSEKTQRQLPAKLQSTLLGEEYESSSRRGLALPRLL